MRNISQPDVAGLDFNLLKVFHYIMLEGGVGRAAQRLGVSQPAVSHSLKKLRALMQDDLFVRSGLTLTPTPRASALATPIAAIIDLVEREVRPMTAFDPHLAQREFRLAMGDLAEVVFLPPLMRLLRDEAPGCSIRTHRLPNTAMVAGLEAAEVELAIGDAPEMPGHMFRQTIFTHDYVCIASADHPRLGGRRSLDWAAYQAETHVAVTSGSETHLREALDRLGVSRRVVLTVGGFLSTPTLLAGTSHIATVPRRLAEDPRLSGGAIALSLPPLPVYPLQSYWHPRSNTEPGHQWLRDRLFTIMNRYPEVG